MEEIVQRSILVKRALEKALEDLESLHYDVGEVVSKIRWSMHDLNTILKAAYELKGGESVKTAEDTTVGPRMQQP